MILPCTSLPDAIYAKKRGKWAWPNGRTERSGQLWAALAGKIECWAIWPGPAVVKKEWLGPGTAWPNKKNSANNTYISILP